MGLLNLTKSTLTAWEIVYMPKSNILGTSLDNPDSEWNFGECAGFANVFDRIGIFLRIDFTVITNG